MKKSYSIILYVILLATTLSLAAYFRLAQLSASPFGFESSALVRIALNYVNTGKLPQAAIASSEGIITPPLIEYILAIPLFFKKQLSTAVQFQAVLSWLSLPILYGFASKLFGFRIAFGATLLMAINPWAVFHGRFIGQANPIPFFATLLLGHLLFYILGNGRVYHLSFAFLWLALIIQLNLTSWVLLPTILIVLLIFRRRQPTPSWPTKIKSIGLGLVMVSLFYWPYLRFDRAANFSNLNAIVNGHIRTLWQGQNNSAWMHLLDLVRGKGLLETYPAWQTAVPYNDFWTSAGTLWLILTLFLGLVYIAQHLRRQPISPRQRAMAFLCLWLIIPIVLQSRSTIDFQRHDFLYLLPPLFLLLSLAAAESGTMIRERMDKTAVLRPVAVLLVISFSGFIIWQLSVNAMGLRQLKDGSLDFGRSVQDVTQIIAAYKNSLLNYPDCDLIILGDSDHPDHSSIGLIEDFIYPTPVRFVKRGQGFIIPHHCTVYATQSPHATAQRWLQTQSQGIDTAPTLNDWQFYHVATTSTPRYESLASWRNGLELIGFRLDGAFEASQRIHLQTSWEVLLKPFSGTNYQFFNHIIDETGTIVAQADGSGVNTVYWQPGDILVNQFDIQLPTELAPGEYNIQTGIYTWPDLRRSRLRRSEESSYVIQQVTISPP